jgi:hypothetical protein
MTVYVRCNMELRDCEEIRAVIGNVFGIDVAATEATK